MPAMRDGLRLLPWSGPLFLLAVFALSALPPSGLFRSEFEIVDGGLSSGSYAAAAVLVILVTVAFFGLATSATSVLLTPVPAGEAPVAKVPAEMAVAVAMRTHGRANGILTPGEPSTWMVVPVLAGLAVLVLLGVHPPGELTNLITQAAAQLRGTP
jgi:hydrogenase-4 component F